MLTTPPTCASETQDCAPGVWLPEEVWRCVAVFLEPWERTSLRRACWAANAAVLGLPCFVAVKAESAGIWDPLIKTWPAVPPEAAAQASVVLFAAKARWWGEWWGEQAVETAMRSFPRACTAIVRMGRANHVWERSPGEERWSLTLVEPGHLARAENLEQCAGVVCFPDIGGLDVCRMLEKARRAREVRVSGAMRITGTFAPSSALCTLELRNRGPLTAGWQIRHTDYPNLRRLVLCNVRLCLRSGGAFASSRHLTHLELDQCDFAEGLWVPSILEAFPSLLRLCLRGSNPVAPGMLASWRSPSLRSLCVDIPLAARYVRQLSFGDKDAFPELVELVLPQLPPRVASVSLWLPKLRYLGTSRRSPAPAPDRDPPLCQGRVELQVPSLVEGDLTFLASICRELHVQAPRVARLDLEALAGVEWVSGRLGAGCIARLPKHVDATHPLRGQVLLACLESATAASECTAAWRAWLGELAAALLQDLSTHAHAHAQDTPALASRVQACCQALLRPWPACCVLGAWLEGLVRCALPLASAAFPRPQALFCAARGLAFGLVVSSAH